MCSLKNRFIKAILMSTHNILFSIWKGNAFKLTQIGSYGISKGLKNEFATTVVNEPLVLEPSKFYCIKLLINSTNLPSKEILNIF